LKGKPGVSHVTAFGNTLHVTGEDEGSLSKTVSQFEGADLRWKKSQPGLEDVFIHLMESAEDNVQ
jgi:ABC-2 type transport system ATP-binding protein